MMVKRINYSWHALFCSGFFYGAAFLFNQWCWWMCGVFLMPLLWCIHTQQTISCVQAGWWAIIAFGMHATGILYVLVTRGENSYIVGLVCIAFFLYCAVHSSLWIFLLQKGKQLPYYKALAYRTTLTMAFFWWIDYGFLWPLGTVQGYPLFFPLVPLIQSMFGSVLLGHLNHWIAWGCIIAMQDYIVYLFIKMQDHRRKKRIAHAILWPLILFFICSKVIMKAKQEENVACGELTKDDVVCFVRTPSSQNPRQHAQDMCEAMMKAARSYPQAYVYIFRESAFPFVLNKHLYALEMWQKNALGNGRIMLLGSAWQDELDGEKTHNCFFCIDECRITHRYEKHHLIPLFEYIPQHLFFKEKLRNLFFQKKELFSPSYAPLRTVAIGKKLYFLPVLCSELFWQNRSSVQEEIKSLIRYPLICLMHDGHFKNSGYDKLMVLAARFRACVEQRKIVYVSFFHAYLIDEKGILHELNKVYF